jgi:hypothetical protein
LTYKDISTLKVYQQPIGQNQTQNVDVYNRRFIMQRTVRELRPVGGLCIKRKKLPD